MGAMGHSTALKFDMPALIVGLAREGTALARFLAERGARVTVTDIKPAEALSDQLAELEGFPVTLALGEHPTVLLDKVDVVFVSPGVPLHIALLEEARRRGLPLCSETRLFTYLCPAPVMGISGSSGKSTTTVLVNEMLRAAGLTTWMGGNIGRPLLEHLDQMAATDRVVMELSSFQLDFFGPAAGDWAQDRFGRLLGSILDPLGWSPHIAALLNVTPNHLDRHGHMTAYVAAKTQILAHQQAGDLAVLNADNAITRRLGRALQARDRQRVIWFSSEQPVEEGACLHKGKLVLRWAGREEIICGKDDLRLLGDHNVANTLAACTLAAAAGAPAAALRQSAVSFTGVEHRLEMVRERKGVRWYNDSIATAPERTVAALQAFPNDPIILLAGGRDKDLPWEEMAALTHKRVRHLILFGEAASLIEGVMRETKSVASQTRIHHAGTLEGATQMAAGLAVPGDVVLLAPGGTSFDAYPDFVARGEHFRELVRALE